MSKQKGNVYLNTTAGRENSAAHNPPVNSPEVNPPPAGTPEARPLRWRQQKHRGLLWFCFWLLFLTTPIAPFAGQFLLRLSSRGLFRISPVLAIGGGLLAGIVGAAFILARLYSNSTKQLIWKTIAFSLLIGIVYGVIGFGGCLLILNGLKNV